MDSKVDEFKPGDRVAKKSGKAFSNGGFVLTVSEVTDFGSVYFVETNTCLNAKYLFPVFNDDPWNAGDDDSEDKSILAAASDHIPSIVVKPSHYAKHPIEPITFIMRNGFEFWRGNIIKYASRAGLKRYEDMDEVQSEITDLEKVRRYAEMRINQLKGESIL